MLKEAPGMHGHAHVRTITHVRACPHACRYTTRQCSAYARTHFSVRGTSAEKGAWTVDRAVATIQRMRRYHQGAKREIQRQQARNRQTIDKVGGSLLSASPKSLAAALPNLKDMGCSPFVLKRIVLGIEEFR